MNEVVVFACLGPGGGLDRLGATSGGTSAVIGRAVVVVMVGIALFGTFPWSGRANAVG